MSLFRFGSHRIPAQVVAATRTATAVTGSIGRQLVTNGARGAVSGGVGRETTRQLISGEASSLGEVDLANVGNATLFGAAFGGGGAALGTGGRAALRNVRVRLGAAQAASEGPGPAAAAIHEPASDRILTGTNTAPSRSLHPLAEQQLREFAELPTTTHPNYYNRAGQQHAEINTLSEALYAREAALGRSMTSDDLGYLLLHVQQRSGAGAGNPMPRCSRCSFATSGIDRTSQLSGAEREQAQAILSGQWPEHRPF